MNRLTGVAGLVALSFIAGMAGMAATARLHSPADRPAAPLGEPAAPQKPSVMPSLPVGLPDFTGIAARTVAGVTNISSVRVVRGSRSPFANDPFFQYFFGDGRDVFGDPSRREASLGSGVIVSNDGYILTNQHVVGGGDNEVVVVLADKRELPGRVIGVDEWTDIALLKVDASDLPAVPWGDSSTLRVADWVLAIGNPFQLSQTVTLGIISAVGRANVGITAYEDFIQTDAAINPGNSGGALINARGELIGINTAIFSQSGGYQGIGFAVPSNLARRVMDDLIAHGEVQRGSIGYLEVAPLTTHVARQLGVTGEGGALVQRMRRDSPAYRAGIRPGDVVVSFNGVPVTDPGHFLRLVSDTAVGATATVEVIRDGRREELRVQVTQASDPRQ
jgi:serine protease Do